MNTIKTYYQYMILSLIMVSCVSKPEIRFLEPQPKNKHDLRTIPSEYQGQYLNKSDSSILTIDSKTIFQEWSGYGKFSEPEMQEALDTVYKEDIEIKLSEKWTINIDIEGDSALISSYIIDTLFELNEKTKLRSYKGYLFLNYPHSDLTWRVKTICLNKMQLDFGDLIRPSQIDSLRVVTPIMTEIDTITNRAKYHDLMPKRKELKEILKQKEYNSQFVKIK